MSVPTSLRLLTCAVLIGLLHVCNAQTNSYNCGQSTISDLRGNITSPSYPGYYDNNQFCSYSIVAPSLSTIKFTFNVFGLEQQDSCVYDYLELNCESDQISRPIRYCGFGDRAESTFKPCSRVLVTFRSDGSVTAYGFSVSYEIEPIRCQGACDPVSNGAGYNCNCDANQTPYSAPAYDQCPVGCYSLSSYCACSSPQTISSTSTSTTTTLPTTTTPIYYSYCGQRTFTDTSGVITSPNYPSYYDNNQFCSYYIVASSLSTIKFTFNVFGLEQQDSCVYDYFELTCESNSVSKPVRYCGSGYRAESSFKPCSRVLVTFRSDGSVTGIGYSVSYEIEPIRCQGDCTPVATGAGYNCTCDANQTPYSAPAYDQCPVRCLSPSTYCACSAVQTAPSTTTITTTTTTTTLPTTNTTAISNSSACGQNAFSGPRGTITSPNYYPYNYENNQYCSYSIDASSLSTIKFTFNRLGLEENYGCTFDWIEFTCESNSISQPIRYCGSGDRLVLSFKGCSRVLVTFRTDGSVTGIGFSVSYDIEPINANQTSSTAPPYGQCPDGCYSSSTYCSCTLPYNTNSTSTSNNTASPANTTATPVNTTTSPFNTTTSPFFNTFPPTNTTGSNSATCGQSTFSSLSGNITSPNYYPNYYENNQYCSYSIVASSLSTIKFTFNRLGLEQHYTCAFDWIEFTCESNSISQPIRYCGSGDRSDFSLKPCSRVLVTFRTDGSVTGIGFSVSYDIEPIRCQGDCTPVSNGSAYNCNCDANQTSYIAPPYDQCPVGCFSSSGFCACSSSGDATTPSYQYSGNTTDRGNTSFVNCYSCSYYSSAASNVSDNLTCGEPFYSNDGGSCGGEACATFASASEGYIGISQTCVGGQYYEENVRLCRDNATSYGVNYFFHENQCCYSYTYGTGYSTGCFCSGSYCNNRYLQATEIPRSNDTTTTFPWNNPRNATANPNPSTTPPRTTPAVPSNATTTTPRPVTPNARNSSGNVTQTTTTTRRPANTTTAPRPVTVNARNSSAGNVAQTTTRRPSNTTTTAPRPVTVNARNITAGNVFQTTTRSYPTTPRPATVNAQNNSGNVSQTTTRRPSNVTTRLV